MPSYFEKCWHSGNDRENPGEVLDPQPEWDKPEYRPGWVVKYTTSAGKVHIGRIRYVWREAEGRLDFYTVLRLKNDAEEITFACSISERIME